MTAITDDIVAGDIPPAATTRPLTPEQRGALAILGSYIKTMRRNGDHATADLLRAVVEVIEDGQAAEAAALVKAWREGTLPSHTRGELSPPPRAQRGPNDDPLCPECHQPITIIKTGDSDTYHAHCFNGDCLYQSAWQPTAREAWAAWEADWVKRNAHLETLP